MAVPKRKQTPSRTGMRRAQNMKFSAKNVAPELKEIAAEQFELYTKAFEAVKVKKNFNRKVKTK